MDKYSAEYGDEPFLYDYYMGTVEETIKAILAIKKQTGREVRTTIAQGYREATISTELGNTEEELLQAYNDILTGKRDNFVLSHRELSYSHVISREKEFSESKSKRKSINDKRIGRILGKGEEIEYYPTGCTITFGVVDGKFTEQIEITRDTEKHKEGDVLLCRGKEAVLDFLSPKLIGRQYAMKSKKSIKSSQKKENDGDNAHVTQESIEMFKEYVQNIEDRIDDEIQKNKPNFLVLDHAAEEAYSIVYKDIDNIPELEDLKMEKEPKEQEKLEVNDNSDIPPIPDFDHNNSKLETIRINEKGEIIREANDQLTGTGKEGVDEIAGEQRSGSFNEFKEDLNKIRENIKGENEETQDK